MNAGLCDTCRHQRVVRTTRGSDFSLCERSRSQPEYPRYPRTPVLACPGWEPGGEGAGEPRGEGAGEPGGEGEQAP
jgi:hypothetical protein